MPEAWLHDQQGDQVGLRYSQSGVELLLQVLSSFGVPRHQKAPHVTMGAGYRRLIHGALRGTGVCQACHASSLNSGHLPTHVTLTGDT